MGKFVPSQTYWHCKYWRCWQCRIIYSFQYVFYTSKHKKIYLHLILFLDTKMANAIEILSRQRPVCFMWSMAAGDLAIQYHIGLVLLKYSGFSTIRVIFIIIFCNYSLVSHCYHRSNCHFYYHSNLDNVGYWRPYSIECKRDVIVMKYSW